MVAAAGAPSSARARYVLAVLFAVLVFSLVDRQIVAILLVPIQRDLGVSDAAMGFLTGFAFAIFNAVAGIPLARLADRRSRRAIIAIGLAAWSIMTAIQGLARSFTHLALARIGVGVGEATTGPAAHSLISDYFPPERRATAIAIYTMGGHVGVFLGMAVGGWLNQEYGWRVAVVAVGLPGLLMAAVVRLTVHEPPRGLSEGLSAETEQHSIGEVFRYLLAKRSFRHLTAAAPLFVFSAYAFNIWAPAFLIRVHGMTTAQVGLWLGLAAGLGGAGGTLVGGALCDRMGSRDARWYMRIPAISALAMIPLSLLFLFLPSTPLALLAFFPMVFIGSFYLGPMYAVAMGLARVRMRGMASAIVHLQTSLFAAGVGPFLIGVLNDRLAGSFGDEAVRYSLLVVVFTNLWGAGHAVRCARSLREDFASSRESASEPAPSR